jgi:2-desacetyl-2-hydroxyethyl bacteriochlorophyllide A dehydrogenase
MKAAVLTAPEKIEIREVETPSPRDGELLVKLKACGVCTLEQRLFTGAMKIGYPLVPGHEAAGEVVEAGPGVPPGFEPGTRVALDLVVRCGTCHFCRTGSSNLCANRFGKGVKPLGGFGEYVVVKATQAFRFPASLSFEEAAFAEPVACCIRSLTRIDLGLAEDLLIMGAGPMGQMHVQVALAMGARVFVSEPDTSRAALALRMGAFAAVDPAALAALVKESTEGRGVDACVVTSPAPAALEAAVSLTRKGGRINVYTAYADTVGIPLEANTLHRSEYLVAGTEGRTEADFYKAVRLLSFGRLDVKPLVSRTVGFGAIEAGIRAALGRETYRVLLAHEGA